MYRLSGLIICFLFSFQLLFSNEIEDFLNCQEDITFKKILIPKNYLYAYKLRIKQPLDHSDPSKGYFYQTVFLSHKDKESVTVLITEGYNIGHNLIYEIAELVEGNQIAVEHRFFGESVPDSMDYRYLNLEQTTADLHHITQIFKKYYTGSWLSSGISKGGQTTIFYRYFYPQDMDTWVPYVAPFNLSVEDKRIYHFFDTIGTRECRESIVNTQTRLFKARDTILPILAGYADKFELHFSYLSLEQAFEYTLLEYPFSFWQWGYSCSDIPSNNAPLGDVIAHVLRVCDISFFADQSMELYGPHYYQAATEMGYYGYEVDGFKEYITALSTDRNPLATFLPNKMQVTFNDSLVHVVYDWLKNEGDNMLYIYGGIDTWSATAVPPSELTNSVWFKLDGRDHRTARIRNMNKDELKILVNSLDEWLNINIKAKDIRSLTKKKS